eukprot:4117801-Pyramimonas_sp.AAC.1
MGRSHIWAAGRLSQRGRGRKHASTPYVPQLALEAGGGETKREPVAPYAAGIAANIHKDRKGKLA